MTQNSSSRLSCPFLRESLFFDARGFSHCRDTGRDTLITTKQEMETLGKSLTESRQRLEEALNSGHRCACTDCPFLERKVWPSPPNLYSHLGFFASDESLPGFRGERASMNYRGESPGIIENALAHGPVPIPSALRLDIDIDAFPFLQDLTRSNPFSVWENIKITLFTTEPSTGLAAIESLLEANLVGLVITPSSAISIINRQTGAIESFAANIRHYVNLNPASVVLKRICAPHNTSSADLDAFLDILKMSGLRQIILVCDPHDDAAPDRQTLDFLGELKYWAGRMGIAVDMRYKFLDAVFPTANARKTAESAYRRQLRAYASVPNLAMERNAGGILEMAIRANDGGLWISGWAYDKRAERKAEEVAVFWRGEPLFVGVCRFFRDYVRHNVDTWFTFHSGDKDIADAVLIDPSQLIAYARFGDNEWWRLKHFLDPTD